MNIVNPYICHLKLAFHCLLSREYARIVSTFALDQNKVVYNLSCVLVLAFIVRVPFACVNFNFCLLRVERTKNQFVSGFQYIFSLLLREKNVWRIELLV